MKINNIITKEKIEKYTKITNEALKEIKKNIIKGKENYAKEIIEMTENYLKDSTYFIKKKDFVNAFAALNYAHGWIDSGVRLDIFNVKDNRLFTVK
jgi:hypothetical protein